MIKQVVKIGLGVAAGYAVGSKVKKELSSIAKKRIYEALTEQGEKNLDIEEQYVKGYYDIWREGFEMLIDNKLIAAKAKIAEMEKYRIEHLKEAE